MQSTLCPLPMAINAPFFTLHEKWWSAAGFHGVHTSLRKRHAFLVAYASSAFRPDHQPPKALGKLLSEVTR